jgi:hypothetical protein
MYYIQKWNTQWHNTAHALCKLVKSSYRQILRICRKYFFSKSTIVTQSHHNDTVKRILQVLFCCCLCKSCCWSKLKIKFPHAVYKRTFFNKTYIHLTDSTPLIIYISQASKNNTKIPAFRRIPAISAKAYVNQFLALPNARYSHNVYIYWIL